MSRVLAFCWREWRAQRGVLLAFHGFGLAALAATFALLPEGWWSGEGRGLLVLSWFVGLGLLGVACFVAPGLVRSEQTARGEQFTQRLPGALAPSFAGKLLFLALATLALPLVCLLAGEAVLAALGRSFPWDLLLAPYDGEARWRRWDWCWPVLGAGGALLLAPWTWACGTWLPKGRMALGGTVLLGLLVGIGVVAVLRQHHAIEKGIAWQSWFGFVPVAGLAVAAASVLARRAGGALRSARAGLAATALVLAVPGAWLAGEVHRYRHPDLGRLQSLSVTAMTPDGRFALVQAAEHWEWHTVPFRVDLRTGDAAELAPTWFVAETLGRWPPFGAGSRRYLRATSLDDDRQTSFDLESGRTTPLALDAGEQPRWPPALHDQVLADLLEHASFRNAHGQRWVVLQNEIVCEVGPGELERRPWLLGKGLVRPAGHGVLVQRSNEVELFDDHGHRAPVLADGNWGCAFLVRDRWLFTHKPPSPTGPGWHQLAPDGTSARVDALAGASVLGLADDDRVLCVVRATLQHAARVFLYRPADGAVTELSLPADFAPQHIHTEPMRCEPERSLLPRDPYGRIWLRCWQSQAMAARTLRRGDGVLWLDPVALTIAVCPWQQRVELGSLVAWPDAHSVLAVDGARIVRIDVATGRREVLFPRPIK